MRIAVTQPNFLPWLGYFELLDRVDCFVALDDVQLVRGSFTVRNRVRSANGAPRWMTLAVARCSHTTPLNRALVSRDRPWWADILRALDSAYGAAPHWDWLRSWLAQALPPRPAETVIDYNLRLLHDLADMTGSAPARWYKASELVSADNTGDQAERLIAICRKLGASDFLNFRKGIDIGLHRPEFFAAHGIDLWRQDYNHPRYSQGDAEFVDRLSVIDLLAHAGPEEAGAIIRSGRAWTVMTPALAV
mgnify:CR=1 FL=1